MKKILSTLTLIICALFVGNCFAVTDKIKVAGIFAVTGPMSFLGGPELRSAQMLIKKINSAGGVDGKELELIVKDSGGSSEKAISFARQLIEEERVFAIIGPSSSGESLKIKRLCQKSKTILISCASADLIVNPVASYVFKTAPSDALAVKNIFATMQEKEIEKIAVLCDNTGFGKAGKKQLLKIAAEYGIKIVATEVYDKSATDLTAIVVKLKSNTDIQAVVNWSVVPAQSILAKNIRQSGWDVPLFQSHGFANIKYVEAAGVAAEGIIFPASRLIIAEDLPDSSQRDILLQYKNGYENKYKEQASTFGGHSYDAISLLVAAIKEAGVDKKAVRLALENTKGLYGTAGEFNLSKSDHSGLGVDAFVMLTVKDGKFVAYKK